MSAASRASWKKLAAGCLLLSVAAVAVFAFSPPASQPVPYGLDARLPVKAYLEMPQHRPVIPGGWGVAKAFPHLVFQDPVFLTPQPNSNRLFVCGREGQVESFDNDPAVASKTMVLDLSAHCQGWDDCGLLGLAFHPDFGKPGSPNRGTFFVWYTYSDHPINNNGNRVNPNTFLHDRLSRFTIPDGSQVADLASEVVLIDQDDRNVYHNGGGMFFGPDRFLYLSLGDEGGAYDNYENGQKIDKSLFSGVIRIDVDCDSSRSHPIPRQPKNGRTAHYFIPDDNPFVGVKDALEEFYAIGLRNPHRMTYDAPTRSILVGNVGQDAWEEVDLIKRGHNYRWSYLEGTHPGPHPKPDQLIGIEEPPIYEYPHANGNSCVIGGYVYRGRQFPELVGKYIFGDNTSSRIWVMDGWQDYKPVVKQLCRMPRGGYSGLSSFGVDNADEIYMCQLGWHDGAIFKLVRTAPALRDRLQDKVPPLLSKTGAFQNVRTLKPAPGLIPYTVNSPLWSDGAVKTRWAAVPDDVEPGDDDTPGDAGRVKFSPTGSFTFPAGTVFVKHFDLPMDDRDPSKTRRVETRLLVRDPDGAVYGATYRWRRDNSDADLLYSSATEDFTIPTSQDVGALTAADIGAPDIAGSTEVHEGRYQLSAGGADVFGTSDQCQFASRNVQGDFDLTVKVDSITNTNPFTKAGLMARESRDPASRYIFAFAYPANSIPTGDRGADFQWRPSPGAPAEAAHPPVRNTLPNTWLRLRRGGNTFSGFISADSDTWTSLGQETIEMPQTIELGLALTSHDAAAKATASFQNLAFVRTQTWTFPSPSDCLTCHTPAAGYVLGVNARQLNGEFLYPSTRRRDNQLRAWQHAGLFNGSVTEHDVMRSPKLAHLNDTSTSLELRARSYLDSNCAQCHRPGTAGAYFDARFDIPLEKQNLIDGPLRTALGGPAEKVIAPGDVEHSMLYRRMTTNVWNQRMPPLARSIKDEQAAKVMAEWIKSLPAQPVGAK